ncbi:MAG: 2-C-methyl-D-erythritol 2,4-cyclodiphosphate synthase [Bacteroidetes bacterium]|nr:2-C-methyl-D-erythritol 2,4-cyclodiphosphate synthase [Bacteroidota bacterium]
MVGFGYDIHRLAAGESLILCGVEIPSMLGTVAHSDGDAALHALTDALLGAAGLGDIGEHFPDTNPLYKNADSKQFVRRALELLHENGLRLINIDITLILESPKIQPYKEAMRAELATMCELPLRRVSVKATTNERVGFVGRKEGVAAFAICQVEE